MNKGLFALTSLILGFSAAAFGQSEKSEPVKYAEEYQRVADKYSSHLKNIEDSADANQFDEHFHKLEAFLAMPGNDKYSNLALCAHLKSVSNSELEYLRPIIESSSTSIALRSCKADLLLRIGMANMLVNASFNLEDDIQSVKKVKFEERVVPELDYLSGQGLAANEVMLTFDDGPTSQTTTNILDALKNAGVKAGFFSTGLKAIENQAVAKRIVQEGHIIGSHSFTHTLMMGREVNCRRLTYDFFMSELVIGHYGVYKAAGYIDPYFRFPNGDFNTVMRKNMKQLGLKVFGWKIDPEDWRFQVSKFKDPDERRNLILKSFISKLGKNRSGIVLMHDIHKQSAEALPLILNYLADQNIKVVLLKPVKRDISNSSNLPMISQTVDYLRRNEIVVNKDHYPPLTADKKPLNGHSYRAKIDFARMFPQMEYPRLSDYDACK